MVGYCTPETPGGKLRAGARTITLSENRRKSMLKYRSWIPLGPWWPGWNDSIPETTVAWITAVVPGTRRSGCTKAFKSHLQHEGFDGIEIPSLGQNYYLWHGNGHGKAGLSCLVAWSVSPGVRVGCSMKQAYLITGSCSTLFIPASRYPRRWPVALNQVITCRTVVLRWSIPARNLLLQAMN